MSVRRTDLLGPIGSSARFDAETGFLHAPIRATRTGVFTYRRKDGTTSRELRHPEDVFDPESLESLKRVPLTKGHPRKSDGSPLDVTTANVERLQVGHAGDTIERVHVGKWDHPQVSATVTRSSVVEGIMKRGQDQVSMGYRTVLVEESGTYLGEEYDRRQTRIRYNHCAVEIPAGRGGHTVAFQLDEADAVQVTDTPPKRKRKTMLKLTIDGATCEFDDTSLGQIVKAALDKRDAQIDTAKADAKTKADALDAATAKLDQASKDLEERSKSDEAAPNTSEAVLEVLEVVAKADAILELDAKAKAELLATKVDEGETLAGAIRKAVVLTACADEADAISKKSDAYLEARFDALTSTGTTASASAQSAENLRKLDGATGKGARADGKAREKTVQERLDEVLSVSDPLEHLDGRNMRTSPRLGTLSS